MIEYILYHYPICPLCRKVRFLLNELNINYKLQETKFWKRDDFLIELNPLGEIPILQDTVNRNVFCDSNAISEYLIEVNKNLLTQNLLSNNEIDRAEIRRIIAISDKSMYNESIKLILEEKVYNVFLHIPYNEKKFKIAIKNLSNFLKYFDFLLTKRYNYLVGSDFSLADIALSTQISSLDYIGNIIEWNKYPKLKDWYSTIKHKPTFQSILEDKITLFEPQKNYTNLNF